MSVTTKQGTIAGEGIFFGHKPELETAMGYTRWFESESALRASEGIIHYSRTTQGLSKSQMREGPEKPKVLRRLRGYVISIEGMQARVAFIHKGQSVIYDFPADRLRKSGISMENQPFQMDEVQFRTAEGMVTGQRFQALAEPSDAYIETVELDESRKKKRDRILKALGQSKG